MFVRICLKSEAVDSSFLVYLCHLYVEMMDFFQFAQQASKLSVFNSFLKNKSNILASFCVHFSLRTKDGCSSFDFIQSDTAVTLHASTNECF